VCRIGTSAAKLTCCEIDFLAAFFTDMLAVKFIGKYFNLCPAILTFTDKRFQISEGFKTWTMTAWCIHVVTSLVENRF